MVVRLLLLSLLVGCHAITDPGALVPPTADQDPRLSQLDLNIAGHRRAVHFETHGDPAQPVLLALHGSLSDYRAFRPLRALADTHHVVLWDQRGSGLSERITADEYTWDSVVAEIDAMINRFSPDRPVTLVGHSFGAMFTALYLTRHPERVERAILIEPAPLTGAVFGKTIDQIITIDLFSAGLAQTFWQNAVLTGRSHEALDYKALLTLADGHTARYHCDPDAPVRWPVWRPGGYVEYIRGVRMGAATVPPDFRFDFQTGLSNFDGPVTLIAGTCSALGPDFQARYIAPAFNSARLVTLEDVGHRMLAEAPDRVVAAIRAALDQ